MVIKLPKENEITSIRISKKIKDELKEVSLPQEPMGLTIQRLINENEDLKKSNERNDELLEFYKFKTSNMDALSVKSEFLDAILENDFGTYNYYLNCYNRLNDVLCDDLSEDEMFNQLKDAYDDCINEIGDDGMETVLRFAKIYCYDEFALLPKLEDEMLKN